MKKLTFAICILLGSSASYAATHAFTEAPADANAGKTKSAVCAACHGLDGNSTNPLWPKLAGQQPSYIVHQLQEFKLGGRKDPSMSPMATPLTDQDMADLAAYFASQTRTEGVANKDETLALGERVYRGGNKDTGLSACIACHGPRGNGSNPPEFPALGSQHAEYTKKQLEDYKNGVRGGKTAEHNELIMRDIALKMSAEEIKAVANYLAGLH